LTFTKIGQDVFPDATEAVLNMAQKFGSVDEAAIQLGKALNDPIQGVTALRRVGVMLTDQQEEQIKAFMAVGDIASAQKVILDELAVEFGGLAKAAGQTAAGQFAIFNNRLDDMKETIGTALIPSLIRFMDALTPIIEAITNAPPWVIDLILAFLALAALAGPLIGFAGTVVSMIGTLSTLGVSFAGLGTAIATVGGFITATLLPAIVALLPVLALLAAAALLVYMVWKNWDTLVVTFQQLWFIIQYGFTQLVSTIVSSFTNGIDSLSNRWRQFVSYFEQFSSHLGTIWSNFTQSLGYLWKALTFLLTGDFAAAVAYFNEALKGFQGQFKDVIRLLSTAFGGAFRGIVQIALRAFVSIASGISRLISAINRLKSSLSSIKLPPLLTPGSPTPFEMGLRGIVKEMDVLSRKSIPNMNSSFMNTVPAGVGDSLGGGGSTRIVDNRRYEAGITTDVLKMAMRDQVSGLTKSMKGVKRNGR